MLYSLSAARRARGMHVNPLESLRHKKWQAWQALILTEFKKQTVAEYRKFVQQDFSERFNESDAADYEYFREDVLMYLRRVKGSHRVIRNVDFGDAALIKRRAHEMAVLILWRRHRHLERAIRTYREVIKTASPELLEIACRDVERVAQSFDYKDNRRLYDLHLQAEAALLK